LPTLQRIYDKFSWPILVRTERRRPAQ
jgi:hypothetical protein